MMNFIFVFIFGLAVGSFLNAVIYRLQTNETIVKGRSHCPYCQTTLQWFELIPVISFIGLKGRCRSCHKKISWQYPLVELVTALLFILTTSLNFSLWQTIYYLIIISVLIVVFVYDLKHYLILDKVIFPAMVLALFVSLWRQTVVFDLLAALMASGFFLFFVLISQGKWMGMGDVKLAVLMGLVLGWPQILAALFLAFLAGAVVGLFLISLKKKGLKSEIPFGPFLAGATILIMFYGPLLTDYFKSLMLWTY